MTSLLAPKRINKMFLRLGARTEALDLKKVATPAQQEVEGKAAQLWHQITLLITSRVARSPWTALGQPRSRFQNS